MYSVRASKSGKTWQVVDSSGVVAVSERGTVWDRLKTKAYAQTIADDLNAVTDTVSGKSSAEQYADNGGELGELLRRTQPVFDRAGTLSARDLERAGAVTLAPVHIPALIVRSANAVREGICAFSLSHTSLGVPATTTANCGPLGEVAVCEQCDRFLRAHERR